MGRKKQFEERIILSLSTDMLTKVDSAREEGEDRMTLIRLAIERELKRRSRSKPEKD